MYQIAKGDTDKIYFSLQNYDLSSLVQPSGYPTMKVFDDASTLIDETSMTRIKDGLYFLSITAPDVLGSYTIEFKIKDIDNVEREIWDILEIVRVTEQPGEEDDFNVAGV